MVVLGGAIGTLLRFGVGGWIHGATGGGFPWGTLLVNVSGCAAIGLVAGFAERAGALPAAWRTVIQVGVLGGYTTFSGFGLETFRLLQAGDPGRALAYVLATNVGCLAAVWLAYRIMEHA